MNPDTVWSAIGLAINEGQSYSEFLPTTERIGVETEEVQNFINATVRKDYRAMNSIIADQEV
jgi:hypothetical protein